MRNNKGFTLIELLAVIVILAIIAVITVPRIASMIEDSRKGAAQDATFGVVKSVELAYAKELQTNTTMTTATCAVDGGAVKCTDSNDNTKTFSASISGTAPTVVSLSIESGGAVATGSTVTVNGYQCTYKITEVTCTKSAS